MTVIDWTSDKMVAKFCNNPKPCKHFPCQEFKDGFYCLGDEYIPKEETKEESKG